MDAFVGDKNVVQYYSFQNDMQDQIRFAGALTKKGYLHVGISPKNAKAHELVDIIDAGILELGESGRLEEIMKKYGL